MTAIEDIDLDEEVEFEEDTSPLGRLMKKTSKKKTTSKPASKSKTTAKKEDGKKDKVVKLPYSDKPIRSKEEMRERVLSIKEEINKQFKDDVISIGSEVRIESYGRLPIGNFALDVATGGGIFVGGVISVSGAYSTGKTLNALHFVAQRQKEGRICLWVAVEPFDAEWARQIGVDTDLLLVAEPSGAEEGLQVAIDCQWRDDVDVVVIDSVEALEPTKYRDKELEDSAQMGIKQRLIGEYLRKFRALNNLRKRRSRKNPSIQPLTLFLINQLREKPTMFGDPEYEPGGRALGYYSDIMIRLRHGQDIYYSRKHGVVYDRKPNDGVVIGSTVKFRVHKNKTFRRAQTGEYDMFIDLGGPVEPGHFDNVKSAIMEGLTWNVIKTPSQGTYEINGIRIRGKEKLVETLREEPELVEYVRDAVVRKLHTNKSHLADDDEEEE